MVAYEAEGAGRLFQDIVPNRKMAHHQTSLGSQTELEIHTEQAFSAVRPDFLSLACLRGDPRAVTYILPVQTLIYNLTPEEQCLLREPLWTTGVDLSFKLHGKEFIDGDVRGPMPILSRKGEDFSASGKGEDFSASRNGEDFSASGKGEDFSASGKGEDFSASGNGEDFSASGKGEDFSASGKGEDAAADTLLRFDQDLMRGITAPAQQMIKKVVDIYYAHRIGHVLSPGEIMVIDNRRAVHGRSPFHPRYDGHDRFLVRSFSVLDYEKTAYARPDGGRVVTAIYS